ncbi:MAG: hypothetical protein UH850_11240 [Paludibacteraceae bacterium]|nr:hypothetical protein [Paludibacteraceae bacterium]
MSNKTRLEAVSSALDTAINTANSLPDAGGGSGGGSVETCTVTIKWSGMAPAYAFISFMGEDGACVDGISAPSYAPTHTINVLKNTMITINNATTNIKSITASDTLLLPEYVMGHQLNSSVPLMLSALNNKSAIFYVTDNSEIIIT